MGNVRKAMYEPDDLSQLRRDDLVRWVADFCRDNIDAFSLKGGGTDWESLVSTVLRRLALQGYEVCRDGEPVELDVRLLYGRSSPAPTADPVVQP